jgi:hypothetical protein
VNASTVRGSQVLRLLSQYWAKRSSRAHCFRHRRAPHLAPPPAAPDPGSSGLSELIASSDSGIELSLAPPSKRRIRYLSS